MGLFAKLVEVLPRLRTQFGMIGLIVVVGGIVATHSLAPASLPAQLAAGLVGVNFLVFGQVFYFLRSVPAQRRAGLVVGLFAIFCLTTVSALGAAVYLVQADRLVISGLAVAGANGEQPSPPNTIDDLVLSWTHQGADEDLQVAIVGLPSGQRIPIGAAAAGDHRLRIPAEVLRPLWPSPTLGDRYQIRVELQGAGRSFASRPLEVQTALLVMYFLADHTVTVASMKNPQQLLNHTFEAKVLAWPTRNGGGPQSVTILATNGKGKAQFPQDFDPDPSTLRCVYIGSVPQSLVRVRNLHTS